MTSPSDPIPGDLLAVLRLICDRLAPTGARWAATGSLGMALQGVSLAVHDVDLQTDAEGAHRIGGALRDYRPEKRALHGRVGGLAFGRLGPAIATIIADGIAAGEFHDQVPRHATAYVMACFGSLHEVLTDAGQVPDPVEELATFVLRRLGFAGEIPA